MGKPRPKLITDENDMEEIDVICPNCGKFRVIKMYWTGGDVTPRIRCDPCKDIVSKSNLGMKTYRIH